MDDGLPDSEQMDGVCCQLRPYMLCVFSLQPPHMGSMMMTQPTMMYTQPVMRPANPFGPNPGAQVTVDVYVVPILPQQAKLVRTRLVFMYVHSGSGLMRRL